MIESIWGTIVANKLLTAMAILIVAGIIGAIRLDNHTVGLNLPTLDTVVCHLSR